MTAPIAPPALRCAPAAADQGFEYHWLQYGREVELWRWKDGRWFSTAVVCSFSSIELHDHGWRWLRAAPPPPAMQLAAPAAIAKAA